MSKPEDKDPNDNQDSIPPPDAPGTDKRSGRVAFDARGNPIWEWQLETGVYSRDVNTQKLRKLDLGGLSILETGAHKKPTLEKPVAPTKAALPGGGFNPYDSSSPPKDGSNPYDNARSLGNKFAPASPAAPPLQRKPADMKKLDAWIRLKNSLKGKTKDKDED